MRTRPSLAVLCIALLLLCCSCGGGSAQSGVQVPDINPKTEIEYAEAIDTMRDAWRARPRAINEENEKAEQRFISRLMSLANRTKGTSNFKATTLLWREVVTEHTSDYPAAK